VRPVPVWPEIYRLKPGFLNPQAEFN